MNEMAQPGWFKRHWKWLVAAGCGVVLVLFAGTFLAVMALVMGMLRSSVPYQHAMQVARSNPAVLMALGEPIHAGFLITGHFTLASNNSDGDVADAATGVAQFAIPINGPRGEGVLRVQGERWDGRWHYSVLSVRIKATGRHINLLGAPWPQANCRAAKATSCNTIRA